MTNSDNFQGNDTFANYTNLKIKTEEAIKKAINTTDLRQAKAYLIEVQGFFKGAVLQKERREELYSKLQQAFEKINQKTESERLQFENEAAKNYILLKSKVEDAEFIAHNPKNVKEAFDFLIEVQSLFKGAKLLREHRENLYTRLQNAFNAIKQLQFTERQSYDNKSVVNYQQFLTKIEEVALIAENEDKHQEVKDFLINLQNEIREEPLSREQRDVLFTKVREIFTIIGIKKEEEQQRFVALSDENYKELKPLVLELLKRAGEEVEIKAVKEELKEIQLRIREAVLQRELRNELFENVQQAFEMVNNRMDAERGYFNRDAKENYTRLKDLVEKGLAQAEVTHEYKDTREFLKKIQSEFKGARMIKEEREELYSRLQTAFEILNRRVDDYFHNKKKNWEVRMQYKLSEYQTEIMILQDNIEKETLSLNELEDQLDIMDMPGNQNLVKAGLQARIASAKIGISKKNQKIEELTNEMHELKNRLEPEEE